MLQALYWSFYQWKWNASSPGGLLHSDHTWSNSSILSSIMKPESNCLVGRLLYYDRMSRVYFNNCFFIQLPCIDKQDSDFCYIVIILVASQLIIHYMVWWAEPQLLSYPWADCGLMGLWLHIFHSSIPPSTGNRISQSKNYHHFTLLIDRLIRGGLIWTINHFKISHGY